MACIRCVREPSPAWYSSSPAVPTAGLVTRLREARRNLQAPRMAMLWAPSLRHHRAAVDPHPPLPFPWFLRLSGPIWTCFRHLPFMKLAQLTFELCAWLTPVTRLQRPELSLLRLTSPALRGPRRLAPELPADWFPNCPAARPGLPLPPPC